MRRRLLAAESLAPSSEIWSGRCLARVIESTMVSILMSVSHFDHVTILCMRQVASEALLPQSFSVRQLLSEFASLICSLPLIKRYPQRAAAVKRCVEQCCLSRRQTKHSLEFETHCTHKMHSPFETRRRLRVPPPRRIRRIRGQKSNGSGS